MATFAYRESHDVLYTNPELVLWMAVYYVVKRSNEVLKHYLKYELRVEQLLRFSPWLGKYRPILP